MTSDNKSEPEQEKMDPWKPLIEKAMQRNNTTLQEMKENLIDSGLDA